MTAKEQINLFASKIIKKFAVKKIILFGSYAKGKSDDSSDVDICIITNITHKRKIEIIRDIRREINPFISFPLDILVYNEKEFNQRAQLKSTLEHKIINEGIELNG